MHNILFLYFHHHLCCQGLLLFVIYMYRYIIDCSLGWLPHDPIFWDKGYSCSNPRSTDSVSWSCVFISHYILIGLNYLKKSSRLPASHVTFISHSQVCFLAGCKLQWTVSRKRDSQMCNGNYQEKTSPITRSVSSCSLSCFLLSALLFHEKQH